MTDRQSPRGATPCEATVIPSRTIAAPSPSSTAAAPAAMGRGRGRRRWLAGAAGAGLASVIGAPVYAQKVIKIRHAHSLSTTEPAHLACEFFAKNVAERSGNRVQIEVFPGEQLGPGKEVNEMIRQGANVMNLTDPGYLSDFVPDIAVLNGPYLVPGPEEFNRIVASAWFKDIEARLQKTGLKLIMKNGYFGQRHMIADKPIRTPADMAGITVRVPPNPMWIETLRAMGGRPTTIQWSEIYSALQQNVVQAAEAPLGSLWGSKLHEVRKTISLTSHFTASSMWPINAGYFARLPAEVQAILLEEGARAGDEQTRLTLAMNQEYIDKFKGVGVTFVESDVAAFRKATAPVYSAFPKWTPKLHETVLATLN